jgi:hypothetical protein
LISLHERIDKVLLFSKAIDYNTFVITKYHLV